MKVAFFVKTLDSQGGGAERVLAQVTGALAKRGHQVTLVSFDAADSPDFYAFDTGVRRVWLNSGRRGVRTSIADAAKRIRSLRRALGELAPDVAVGFMHSAYVPLALAAMGTGVPVIGSEHIVYSHYRRFPLEALILRLSAPLYSRIAIVSETVRQSFPRILRDRMSVVENPVQVGQGDGADASDARQDLVLSVGRLAEQKNQAVLIAAFDRIARKHPGWKLRIVGEGDLRPQLEEQVRDLGLQDRVEFPGATREIWREYATASIFVLPSAYESVGLATAEALSMGLPAIGFADCPGTNELIRHGLNGLLVEPVDRVTALADAVDELIESPQQRQRMGDAARTSVDHLSLEHVVDRWEELLGLVRPDRLNPRSGRPCTGSS